jgi:hypothetical protein
VNSVENYTRKVSFTSLALFSPVFVLLVLIVPLFYSTPSSQMVRDMNDLKMQEHWPQGIGFLEVRQARPQCPSQMGIMGKK